MSVTKCFTSLWVITFYFHIRVAKSYNDYATTRIFNVHTKLFAFVRCSEWFVKSYSTTLIFCRSSVFSPIFILFCCFTLFKVRVAYSSPLLRITKLVYHFIITHTPVHIVVPALVWLRVRHGITCICRLANNIVFCKGLGSLYLQLAYNK